MDPTNDPLIPVRLSVLIDTFLGIREKGCPHKEIQAALRAVPSDIAKQHFHIQEVPDSLPYFWSARAWIASGLKEEQMKADNERWMKSADALTDWLMANIPFLSTDRVFTRQVVFSTIKANTWDAFKTFGLTDEQIAKMKAGDI